MIGTENTVYDLSGSKSKTEQQIFDVRGDTIVTAMGTIRVSKLFLKFDVMRIVRKFFDKKGGIIPGVMPELSAVLMKEVNAFAPVLRTMAAPDGYLFSVHFSRTAPGSRIIDSATAGFGVTPVGKFECRPVVSQRKYSDKTHVAFTGNVDHLIGVKKGTIETDPALKRFFVDPPKVSQLSEEMAVTVVRQLLLDPKRPNESSVDLALLDYQTGFRWISRAAK